MCNIMKNVMGLEAFLNAGKNVVPESGSTIHGWVFQPSMGIESQTEI